MEFLEDWQWDFNYYLAHSYRFSLMLTYGNMMVRNILSYGGDINSVQVGTGNSLLHSVILGWIGLFLHHNTLEELLLAGIDPNTFNLVREIKL